MFWRGRGWEWSKAFKFWFWGVFKCQCYWRVLIYRDFTVNQLVFNNLQLILKTWVDYVVVIAIRDNCLKLISNTSNILIRLFKHLCSVCLYQFQTYFCLLSQKLNFPQLLNLINNQLVLIWCIRWYLAFLLTYWFCWLVKKSKLVFSFWFWKLIEWLKTLSIDLIRVCLFPHWALF